jgi:hypothetical protein
MTFRDTLRPLVLACTVLGAALIGASSASATNIIQNGGFETGALSPWYQDNDFAVPAGVNWTVNSADAHSGTFSAYSIGNKELRQDFAATAVSSIDQLSFWMEHPNWPTAKAYITFFYTDSSHASFTEFSSSTGWQFFDVTNLLNATKTLVGFSIYGYDQADAPPAVTRLDDFVITVRDPAPAPEPAAWALMITGFGFAGAMLRRRRVEEARA